MFFCAISLIQANYIFTCTNKLFNRSLYVIKYAQVHFVCTANTEDKLLFRM